MLVSEYMLVLAICLVRIAAVGTAVVGKKQSDDFRGRGT